MFYKKVAVKNFTEKHLRWNSLLNNGTPARLFSYEFCDVFQENVFLDCWKLPEDY